MTDGVGDKLTKMGNNPSVARPPSYAETPYRPKRFCALQLPRVFCIRTSPIEPPTLTAETLKPSPPLGSILPDLPDIFGQSIAVDGDVPFPNLCVFRQCEPVYLPGP